MLKFDIAYHTEGNTLIQYELITAFNLFEAKERMIKKSSKVIYIIDELCREVGKVSA